MFENYVGISHHLKKGIRFIKAGARVRKRLRLRVQTFLLLPGFFYHTSAHSRAPSSSSKSPLHFFDFLKSILVL